MSEHSPPVPPPKFTPLNCGSPSSTIDSPITTHSTTVSTTRALPSIPPVDPTYPPPASSQHDHIVPFESLPPSPQTPSRRTKSTTNSNRVLELGTPTSTTGSSSPRSPRRATRGRSTSIDYSHSLNFDYNDDGDEHVDSENREVHEGQPLMLPFNYHSVQPHPNPKPPKLPAKRRSTQQRKRQTRLLTMRYTVIFSTLAVTVICWLSWKIVLTPDHEGLENSLSRDEIINLISTRFDNATTSSSRNTAEEQVNAKEEVELGKDGDLVKMENGETFIFRNPFGGTFIKPTGSSSLAAQAQNDTPSLAKEWDYETMTISGVNLGGWLTLEPFITPAIFEPFLNSTSPTPAVDEYTLSQNLLHQGGEAHLLQALENHYETFITEKDFAEIAGAGLNWVRIPLPFWSISKWQGEPFLEKTSWKYFLKALEWSRKYGLRVNLDLHSVPGSQNGWNHSGKWGSINWLHGTMGYANAQRSLDYIETLAEFVSRPEVAEVVKMFSLLNEPMMNIIGTEPLRSFYAKAYRVIRAQTGYGSGPIIAIHDGFKGTRRWFDFPTSQQFRDFPVLADNESDLYVSSHKSQVVKTTGGMDRVAIDSHRYLAFSEPDTRSIREQILKPCQKWATDFNKTFNGFGIPIAGEFSIAPNDCGRFLNNVNQGTRLEGTFLNDIAGKPVFNASVPEGSCAFWEDYENWSDELKTDLRDLAYAQMDTFQNWFYWTWKTSPSLEHPQRFANPLWSYSLGLAQGWLPQNPRRSAGFCYDYAQENQLMAGMPRRRMRKPPGEMEGWKVGRDDSQDRQRVVPTDKEDASARYPWPPKYFLLDPMSAPASFDEMNPKLEVARLPRYAQTTTSFSRPGPPPSFTPDSPKGSWHVPVAGCDYPETWNSANSTGWSETCLSPT